MVIQRNIREGVHTFENKKWKDYKEGFGDLSGSKLWYGLDGLNTFTKTGQWELRIDFQFENQSQSYLHYSNFSVGTEYREYPLTIGGFIGITSSDPFATHPLNGKKFSTADNDNDDNNGNCALGTNGGWWYSGCSHIDPNYQRPVIVLNSNKLYLKSMEMKMRPRNCIIR